MHKYMELRPDALKKSNKKTLEDANTGADDSDEPFDADLEKFADEEMEREMKRMVQGAPGGMPDSDEEDVILSRESDVEDEEDDDGGFFSGEDDL